MNSVDDLYVTGYGSTLAVIRQGWVRHGDRATAAVESLLDGWEIAPDFSNDDAGGARDVTTTRVKAYGGPVNPDIRRDDRVFLAPDPRTAANGAPTEPPWQVVGDIERWGPGLAVVTLQRVSG